LYPPTREEKKGGIREIWRKGKRRTGKGKENFSDLRKKTKKKDYELKEERFRTGRKKDTVLVRKEKGKKGGKERGKFI